MGASWSRVCRVCECVCDPGEQGANPKLGWGCWRAQLDLPAGSPSWISQLDLPAGSPSHGTLRLGHVPPGHGWAEGGAGEAQGTQGSSPKSQFEPRVRPKPSPVLGPCGGLLPDPQRQPWARCGVLSRNAWCSWHRDSGEVCVAQMGLCGLLQGARARIFQAQTALEPGGHGDSSGLAAGPGGTQLSCPCAVPGLEWSQPCWGCSFSS